MKYLLMICLSLTLYSQELITIDTREGIQQRFLINEAKDAVAVALLFAGGKGKLKLHKNEEDWNVNNFLIRSRNYFNENNIITLSVDAPSKLPSGMVEGFRSSNEHQEDIKKIIEYVTLKYPHLPIWLIGTSRGTVSATFNTLHQKNIHGLVITSPLTVHSKGSTPVTSMPLEKITQPTLIVAHKDDSCKVTPPNKAQDIIDKLNNSKNKELKLFEGGISKGDNPCKNQSHHGFLGIEKEVVNFITKWIKSN